jgi:hypothetical protein
MKIALCTDITEFHANRVLNREWAKRFPGAAWLAVFADLVRQEGHSAVTGDVALANVHSGNWNAKEVLVLQELDSGLGRQLIDMGAKPAVLTGAESPLIAYEFYDKLPELAPTFEHRVLFGGALETFAAGSGRNYRFRFPNYHPEDIPVLAPWAGRKKLVMVTANKFYQPTGEETADQAQSKTRAMAIQHELQSKRLEAIEFFASEGLLDLFGHGWNEPERLPGYWQEKLEDTLKSLQPHPCEDKIRTMAAYKFAICFENMAYPGYITEKIIDCFVAGVIPIYLGAPDVQEYIPADAFIDMRQFSSWQGLTGYLGSLPEKAALDLLAAGREFLNSPEGRLYSFAGFARFIRDMIFSEGGCRNEGIQ